MVKAAVGLDYGTESVRALAVDCVTGKELAGAVYAYPHGVITSSLPGSDIPLPPEFALQSPSDYREGALHVIREVLKTVPAENIVGLGVDFTACTVLPVDAAGEPLCFQDRFKNEPHAWVKLWKHHAAEPQAERVTAVAQERNEAFLKYCGGAVSCEWFMPKCLETLQEAPEVYTAADKFMEAGDWIIYQMTGTHSRNACCAGYKGQWIEEEGNPSRAFLEAVHPDFGGLFDKTVPTLTPAGCEAGSISEDFAAASGLKADTPVSAAIIDAHSGVPGMGVYEAGPLCMIMGTSGCHLLMAEELKLFEGYAGLAKDGILPGLYAYESGQAAVGDIFGWFAKGLMGRPFAELEEGAAALQPGESGLVALDWMNGNRSILMNPGLSGMLLGLTLATTPADIYRALIEATAFGTKVIVDSYVQHGVPVDEVVACGGLIQSDFIMQVYADILQLPVKTAASAQAVALGSAVFGTLAAGAARGGYDDVRTAVNAMTRPPSNVFKPRPAASGVYSQLFGIYQQCHDEFGINHTEPMRLLKQLKAEAKGVS